MKKFMLFWTIRKFRNLLGKKESHNCDLEAYISNKHNFANFYISKNACTSIKAIICDEYLNRCFENDTSKFVVHGLSDQLRNKKVLIKYGNKDLKDLCKNKVKFMVYRDPIERFISVYKEIVFEMTHKESQTHYLKKIYRKSKKMSFSIDDFLILAKYENMFPYPFIEQHIASQYCYYEKYSRLGIDYLVNIKNLDKFCKEILHIEQIPHVNTDNKRILISLTPKQIEQAKKIYKNDYKIVELFQGNKEYL